MGRFAPIIIALFVLSSLALAITYPGGTFRSDVTVRGNIYAENTNGTLINETAINQSIAANRATQVVNDSAQNSSITNLQAGQTAQNATVSNLGDGQIWQNNSISNNVAARNAINATIAANKLSDMNNQTVINNTVDNLKAAAGAINSTKLNKTGDTITNPVIIGAITGGADATLGTVEVNSYFIGNYNISPQHKNVAVNYTVPTQRCFQSTYIIDSRGGNRSFKMPGPGNNTYTEFIIIKEYANNTLTILANNTEKFYFKGSEYTSLTSTIAGDFIILVSNSTAWFAGVF